MSPHDAQQLLDALLGICISLTAAALLIFGLLIVAVSAGHRKER